MSEHKHFLNKKFAITFVILLLLGGGAYAGIWYWGNQQQSGVYTFEECVKSKGGRVLETYPEQCVTKDGQTFVNPNQTAPEPPVSGNVPADWKTYTNTKYGFEIKYPQGSILNAGDGGIGGDVPIYGTASEVRLRPSSGQDAVFIVTNSISPQKLSVDWISHQYLDSTKIHPTAITMFGLSGFKVPHDNYVASDWYYLQKADGSFVSIVVNGSLADQILSTFKFTESNSGSGRTMCTQEAKLCPDGSAVGRTGPNCEFTACP